MQNRFLYFPNDDRPSSRMLAAENMELCRQRGRLPGMVSAGNQPAPGGTIVSFTVTVVRRLTGDLPRASVGTRFRVNLLNIQNTEAAGQGGGKVLCCRRSGNCSHRP
jgi:hypothetical protein